MKSGKRYVVSAGEDKYVAVQRAPNQVEIYDSTAKFNPLGKMDIVPSIDIGSIRVSTEPLIYASNP